MRREFRLEGKDGQPNENAEYREPTFKEKILNKVFEFLVGLGFGLPYNYLLQVQGQKSGRIYSMPQPLEIDGKKFLVAPGGRTQRVRNVERPVRLRRRREA